MKHKRIKKVAKKKGSKFLLQHHLNFEWLRKLGFKGWWITDESTYSKITMRNWVANYGNMFPKEETKSETRP